ncbi:MAG TPA: hypothetical protein VN674_06155 [Gemmatimonadales bacterium]|nr:hypothetical protein [Gemmatimonadales bacterium]
MSHAVTWLLRAGLGGIAVAAVLSCKNVDDPPAPAAIAGSWQYTETLSDNLFQITCADTGVYTFNQDGPKFSGNYVQSGICENQGSKFFNTGHGPVTNGSVTNVRLQFTASELCSYTGQLSAAHDAVNAGTGICDFVDSSTSRHYSMQITWQMTRQ